MSGLLGSMAAALALLLLVNIAAARLGLAFEDGGDAGGASVKLEPPGWLVVLAWFLLLPAIGAAHHRLVESGAPSSLRAGVVLLAALASTYAWTTVGLARLTTIPVERLGLGVNAIVAALSVVLATHALAFDLPAAALIGAVALWTVVASISVVQYVARGSDRPGSDPGVA